MSDSENQEVYYLKYRPRSFKAVMGQPEAVKQLEDFVRNKRVPRALLFVGNSGTGKTTLARIMKDKLGCGDADYCEVNAADARGIDDIREIKRRMGMAPMSGSCRIWLIDEAQKVTSDAQSALLKILEDTPKHVYFMLCTTDPNKLLKTIHSRCTEIKLNAFQPSLLKELVQKVATKEYLTLSDEVVERIAEVADGSPRKALVLLHQVSGLSSDVERLETIQKGDQKRNAYEIVKALLWESRSNWGKVANIIKNLEDGQEWEGLRHLILTNATNELLKAGKNSENAYHIITAFESNWFDSKKAGLVRACYEVMSARKN